MCPWLSLQAFGLQTQPIRAASGNKAQHVPLLTSTGFGRKRTELEPQCAQNRHRNCKKGGENPPLLAQSTLTTIFQSRDSATSASDPCGTLRNCFLPSPAWLLLTGSHYISRAEGKEQGKGGVQGRRKIGKCLQSSFAKYTHHSKLEEKGEKERILKRLTKRFFTP